MVYLVKQLREVQDRDFDPASLKTMVLWGADEIERLQEAKRAALKVADERSKENVKLRAENERMRAADAKRFKLFQARNAEIERLTAALKICGAPFDTGPTTINGAAQLIAEEFERRMNVAANTLNDGTVSEPTSNDEQRAPENRKMAEDTIYLTVDRDREKGGFIAVISRGTPQFGDANVTILSVERVKNVKAAKAWYRRMKQEQPWARRH